MFLSSCVRYNRVYYHCTFENDLLLYNIVCTCTLVKKTQWKRKKLECNMDVKNAIDINKTTTLFNCFCLVSLSDSPLPPKKKKCRCESSREFFAIKWLYFMKFIHWKGLLNSFLLKKKNKFRTKNEDRLA